MIPFILAGAVLGISTGVMAYRKYKKNEAQSLGKFAIWGRPDVGKTTFINFLRGVKHQSEKKEATTHKQEFSNTLQSVAGCKYVIDKIIDMPGTMDRLDDWLAQVRDCDHVFYMLDLSRREKSYVSQIKKDLKATMDEVGKKSGDKKKIHIIVTHIDQSYLKNVDASKVHNEVQNGDLFREIYESGEGVCGYVYVANLTNPDSCTKLITSIVGDCKGA